jgi:hypothetical protein
MAKDLYDLRSAIAHGGDLKDKAFRVGQEELALPDVAKRATESLRTVIRRFLPHVMTAPHKKAEFWDRAYFGLPQEESNQDRLGRAGLGPRLLYPCGGRLSVEDSTGLPASLLSR